MLFQKVGLKESLKIQKNYIKKWKVLIGEEGNLKLHFVKFKIIKNILYIYIFILINKFFLNFNFL